MEEEEFDIIDKELSEIFEEDVLVDDTEEATNDENAETIDEDILADIDLIPEEEEVIDINQDEFVNELVEESEDVVIENVNDLLNEYKFTKSRTNDNFRYIFDEILSKYWYDSVLNEEKENVDKNMYYRWLAVVDFDDLLRNESWENFILTEGNGEKIIDIYEQHELPELDDKLQQIYEEPDLPDEVAPDLELGDVLEDDGAMLDIDEIEEEVADDTEGSQEPSETETEETIEEDMGEEKTSADRSAEDEKEEDQAPE